MLDLHSHYLPAIDDGAKSLEDSIAMLRRAAADGITTIVVTPHMFIDSFRENTAGLVKSCFDQFLQALQTRAAADPDDATPLPTVLLGAENFVNERFVLDLEKGAPVLTLNQTSYILLEFPLFGTFNHMDRLLSALFARGLTPLFAHPERNAPFQRDPQVLHRLVARGACLQLDSMSLLGGFGAEAKALAFYLLRNNLAHCVASDAHDVDRRSPILSKARAAVAKTLGESQAQLLFTGNPERIVHDAEVLSLRETAGDPPRARSWLASLLRWN